MSTSRVSDSSLPTLRIQPGGAALDPSVTASLTPGTIVTVTIQREPGERQGFLLNGSFVAATIPAELEHNATVELLVARSSPAYILRVVSLDPKPLAQRPSTLLDDAFRAFLSPEDLTDLKEAFRAVDRNLGQSLSALHRSVGQAATSEVPLRELHSRLTTTLDQLQVLDEPILRDSTKVMQTLREAFIPSGQRGDRALGTVINAVAASTNAVTGLEAALSEARELPLALKAIDTIRSEIARLRLDPQRLTFGDSTGPDEAKRLPADPASTPTHALAIAAGRSHSFAELIRRPLPGADSNTPLLIFLRTLGALLPEFSRGDSSIQQSLSTTIRQLLGELNRTVSGPQERQQIEAALSQAEQRLDSLARSAQSRTEAAKLLVTSADVTREIERVTSGQEILRHLAPLAQSVGEPIAIFLPAVVHGLLTKFEFAFHPPAPSIDREEHGDQAEPDRLFERVDLTLPLAALGAVRVAIAHRPGEILMNVTCESTAAHAFIETMLPKLEVLLEERGYSQRAVTATVGEASSALPEWCRHIARSNVVA